MLTIDPKRERILGADGHVLVTGGPGSGKTTVALLKAKYRIDGGLLPGQSVLFLSFSRAAVARIASSAKSEEFAGLKANLSIQTFHSWCWSILKAHGYLLGTPRHLQLLLPSDLLVRKSTVALDDDAWNAEVERLFMEEGLASFDLFASKTRSLLKSCPSLVRILSSCFPMVIVDEAQDTDENQWHCIRELAKESQIVCLADLEQQIYSFREGVSSERVLHLKEILKPLEVDLSSENSRSGDLEILQFANDILSGNPRGAPYSGVGRRNFAPKKEHRDKAICSSVGQVYSTLERTLGRKPDAIAILARENRGVGIISAALCTGSAGKAIPHRVLSDETFELLSFRAVAALLQGSIHDAAKESENSQVYRYVADALRGRGTKPCISDATTIESVLNAAVSGRRPKVVTEIDRVVDAIRGATSPTEDWHQVLTLLEESSSRSLRGIAAGLRHPSHTHRTLVITRALAKTFLDSGSYADAVHTVEALLEEEQLMDGFREERGTIVSTIHKAKGKEFDAVIVYEDAMSSPLVSQRDCTPGYIESRRLLRVAITRAKRHVLMLVDASSKCPLLDGHELWKKS